MDFETKWVVNMSIFSMNSLILNGKKKIISYKDLIHNLLKDSFIATNWENDSKGTSPFIVKCYHMEALPDELITTQIQEVNQIIEKHKDVFQDLSMKLSPSHETGHVIELQPSSTPTIIDPYHYLHHHRTKINIWLRTATYVVITSRSPYSSPIILVREKV